MTRRWPVIGLVFGVVWLFVRGAETTVDAVLAELLTGVAVGLPIAFVFRRLYGEDIDIGGTLAAIPYAVLYGLVFVREVIEANVDVTYRVLAPSMPIEPEVIYIPLRVQSDIGVTTIANSITITPGTITLDHDPDENALYVHVIDGRNPEQIVAPIRTWEDYALAMFDEELSPGDPAPPVRVTPEDKPPEPKTATVSIEALDMGRGPPTAEEPEVYQERIREDDERYMDESEQESRMDTEKGGRDQSGEDDDGN